MDEIQEVIITDFDDDEQRMIELERDIFQRVLQKSFKNIERKH